MAGVEPAEAVEAVPVVFHFNVDQPLHYAGRLVRKIHRMRQRVTVWGDAGQLKWLDEWLWANDQLSFIPHALPKDGLGVRERSAVWLSEICPDSVQGVLVNLTGLPVLQAGRIGRLIEIVASEEGARDAARQRWRLYQRAGFQPIGHDASVR